MQIKLSKLQYIPAGFGNFIALELTENIPEKEIIQVFRNLRSWHYWHFILLKYEDELVTSHISFDSVSP